MDRTVDFDESFRTDQNRGINHKRMDSNVKNIRTILYTIYYVAMATAIVALVFLLFALGHTETYSTRFTLVMTFITGFSALVVAMLQWVGLPAKEDSSKESSNKHSK